jgi:SRSO17 transposase
MTYSFYLIADLCKKSIVEHLGDSPAIAVLDETGFLKQGDKSVGVGRQYSGTAGRVENCQIGVFLGYVTHKGNAFLDREIYLPQDWVDDQQRREAAGVPKEG